MLARGRTRAASSPQDQEDSDEARRLRQQARHVLGGGMNHTPSLKLTSEIMRIKMSAHDTVHASLEMQPSQK